MRRENGLNMCIYLFGKKEKGKVKLEKLRVN